MRKLIAVVAFLGTSCGPSDTRSLITAAENGDLGVVRALVEKDAGLVNSHITARKSIAVILRPLHAAASGGNVEIISYLLDKGADLNATLYSGQTALHAAAGSGKVAAVALLLKRGAKVDARERTGETALHRAPGYDDGATIQALLAAGADVNARTEDGSTPLHVIAAAPDVAGAAELCSRGADPQARDKAGLTPAGRANSESGTVTFADVRISLPSTRAAKG